MVQVGAGKSSLLAALLGELHCLKGGVNSCGTLAYTAQVGSGAVRQCGRNVVEDSQQSLRMSKTIGVKQNCGSSLLTAPLFFPCVLFVLLLSLLSFG